jgi:hypothetical protein
MRKLHHRFFIFLSCMALMGSCIQYRNIQKTKPDTACLLALKPDFSHSIYQTNVDVFGHHISGLLLFKKLPDSSTRIVFTNQVGFTYFDFGFSAEGAFKVYQITPQMNKEGLIRTLRGDFEILLFKQMDSLSYGFVFNQNMYYAFPQQKGIHYYITDSHCQHLLGVQRSSGSKSVMDAQFFGMEPKTGPDSIYITHHVHVTFNISLKKISPLVSE